VRHLEKANAKEEGCYTDSKKSLRVISATRIAQLVEGLLFALSTTLLPFLAAVGTSSDVVADVAAANIALHTEPPDAVTIVALLLIPAPYLSITYCILRNHRNRRT
jgi:hypothetical protein